MKTIMLKIVIALSAVSLFISCSSSEEQHNGALFDFGVGTYQEPFVGILKSHPKLLVKSLEYPPFSWFKPDTLSLEKDFFILFNEECIRSKTQAVIHFTDEFNSQSKYIDVSVNGQPCKNGMYYVNGDSLGRLVTIRVKVNPLLAESSLVGHVIVKGEELDKVNDLLFQSKEIQLTDWTLKQKLEWPIMLWLSWLLTFLLALVIIAILLICIFRFITYIIALLRRISIRKTKSVKKRKSEKKEKEEEDALTKLFKRYPEFKSYIKAIQNSSPIVFCRENFRLEIDSLNRNKYTLWVEAPDGSGYNCKITIIKNTIKAKAGCLEGKEAENTFLNFVYLLPTKKFIIDDYFEYELDDCGRVVHAYADRTNIFKNCSEVRNTKRKKYSDAVKSMSGLSSDDGGHIFSNNTQGPNEWINIVPMNRALQRPGGRWRDFEIFEENAIEEGKKVVSERTFYYEGRSMRPFKIEARVFINDKMGKTFEAFNREDG